MTKPALSIVFPAYNEGARIKEALTQALAYLEARGLDAEIVVVDDGSTDDTEAKVRAFTARYPQVNVQAYTPNGGKGLAVKRGMLAARGRYRVFLDVDLATPVTELDRLVPVLEEGADFVLGSRHCPGAVVEVKQGRLRRFMGWVFRKIAGWLLPLEVSDVTCGFKGMREGVAEELFGVVVETGWAFDAELIHVARTWGLDVREVPVRWRNSGDSRVRAVSNAGEALGELIRIRCRDRRGAYVRREPGDDS